VPRAHASPPLGETTRIDDDATWAYTPAGTAKIPIVTATARNPNKAVSGFCVCIFIEEMDTD